MSNSTQHRDTVNDYDARTLLYNTQDIVLAVENLEYAAENIQKASLVLENNEYALEPLVNLGESITKLSDKVDSTITTMSHIEHKHQQKLDEHMKVVRDALTTHRGYMEQYGVTWDSRYKEMLALQESVMNALKLMASMSLGIDFEAKNG